MGNQSSSSSSHVDATSFTARRRRRGLLDDVYESTRTSISDAATNAASTFAASSTTSNMDEIRHGLSFQPKSIGVANQSDMRQRSFERREEYQRKQQRRSERLAQIGQAWGDHKRAATRYNKSNDGIMLNKNQQDDTTVTTPFLCGLCCC
jgi:hypothetical protein